MEVKTYKGKDVHDILNTDEMKKMLEAERKKAIKVDENFKPFEVRLMFDASDDTVMFMSPDKKTFNSVEVSYLMTKALNELIPQHSLYRSLKRDLTIAHVINLVFAVAVLIKLFIIK